MPGYEAPPQTYAPAQRWVEIMIDIVRRGAQGFDDDVEPELREGLEELRHRRSPGSPLGGIAAALAAWAQLHGLVALEIHGQTAFVLGEADGLFAYCVERQVCELGLTRPS